MIAAGWAAVGAEWKRWGDLRGVVLEMLPDQMRMRNPNGRAYACVSILKPMKYYNGHLLPVGVSLTHDKGRPVVFAYVGGHGRVRMKAKRFNPVVWGTIDEAIIQATAWRAEAIIVHEYEVAALSPKAHWRPGIRMVTTPKLPRKAKRWEETEAAL